MEFFQYSAIVEGFSHATANELLVKFTASKIYGVLVVEDSSDSVKPDHR